MCFSATRIGGRWCPRRFRRRHGFSLVEIMVVVVIIGLLAGTVTLSVNHFMDSAKTNRAKGDLATIVDAVEGYYLTQSRYPTSDEGLGPLPLQNELDPWGRPYEYNYPASEGDWPFEVYTLGADGREGGDGINADIYSWQLGEVEEAS